MENIRNPIKVNVFGAETPVSKEKLNAKNVLKFNCNWKHKRESL